MHSVFLISSAQKGCVCLKKDWTSNVQFFLTPHSYHSKVSQFLTSTGSKEDLFFQDLTLHFHGASSFRSADTYFGPFSVMSLAPLPSFVDSFVGSYSCHLNPDSDTLAHKCTISIRLLTEHSTKFKGLRIQFLRR